jgi:hypothetical protein
MNTLTTSSPAELEATFEIYKKHQPTIIGLQETNKNWNKYDATVGRVRRTINRLWTGAKLVTANTHDEAFQGPCQPGGVAQMVLRQLTGRVTKHGKGLLRRYVWQEILLDGSRTLIVVTAYRVVQERARGSGPTTSYMQQWRRLRANGTNNPNPRQQILDDLKAFLQPHKEAGNEIIITIDANAAIDTAPIDTFMEDLELWDLMADYLPTPAPTTYQRGQTKLDHIIGTASVFFAVKRAYIIPFGIETPKSDHAICGVDFSLEAVCGITPQSLHDPTHPSS